MTGTVPFWCADTYAHSLIRPNTESTVTVVSGANAFDQAKRYTSLAGRDPPAESTSSAWNVSWQLELDGPPTGQSEAK